MYKNIRDLREDHDLKQRQLAKYLRCSQRSYSDYENGRTRVPPNILIELSRFYGTSVDYLSKAGTTIFVASIVMWLILNLGLHGFTTDMNQSFGAMIGKVLVPIFVPIGLGYWQIVLALISGIAAKEVVVSSCSVLFGVGNVTTQTGMLNLSTLLSQMGFGARNAYALMVFCLLYVPCMAAVATIKKETGSWRLTIAMAMFQLVTAWVVAFLVFWIGGMI